ncbi:uncharacterized protein LOC123322370 [Coccinella septempunctata]|uniref:uncharacterized protein LOC123322370 n=1 Tax=Coccinella septempunctata TaxID=41139 RepID=UPI001D091E30|nr:uncharacterized protein LOC123322370 [Coccinella septempunctata]
MSCSSYCFTNYLGHNLFAVYVFLHDLFQIADSIFYSSEISLKTGDTPRADVLILPNNTFEDEGWYACVAANSLGSTSSLGYLHVIEPPVLPMLNPFIILMISVFAVIFMKGFIVLYCTYKNQ